MCAVDNDGVDVRHIDTRFEDGGRDHHIVFVIHKVQNNLFQFFGRHLSVADDYTYAGNQSFNKSFHFVDVVDTVVDKKHLPVAFHFKRNSLTDYVFVEFVKRRLYRVAVRWRSVDDGKIAGSHQRKL